VEMWRSQTSFHSEDLQILGVVAIPELYKYSIPSTPRLPPRGLWRGAYPSLVWAVVTPLKCSCVSPSTQNT
jgi:hypothetical protein